LFMPPDTCPSAQFTVEDGFPILKGAIPAASLAKELFLRKIHLLLTKNPVFECRLVLNDFFSWSFKSKSIEGF
jgi:hypothetical protein